jgi:hypothetical protein
MATVHGQANVMKALIKALCGLNNVGLQDGSIPLLMAAHKQNARNCLDLIVLL